MSFNTLGLQDSLLRAIEKTGYTTPTPIQAQAIPAILSGNDVMAAAQTGTGKTAGFTLPLLQLLSGGTKAKSNHTRALILTPTRELAAQIKESIDVYGTNEGLSSAVIFGGVKINPQLMAMRKGKDILVATPGRLLDLYQQNAVKFSQLEVLVLDEADRMLDMGFIRDIQRILKLLPKVRQNLMFSATFSDEIRALTKGICNNPVEIDVAPRNSTVDTIEQAVYLVKKENKTRLLSTILRSSPEQTLVFSRTKHGANKLVKVLAKDGVSAAAIHGNKTQNQRTKALDNFKANKVQVLVATDIAARGIDIDLLAQVINFDLPNVSEDYVHRIGRTGRAGAKGLAMSLVSPDEKNLLKSIERLIKRKIEKLELPEFMPVDEETLARVKDAEEKARVANQNKPKNKAGSGAKRKPRRQTRKPSGNGNSDEKGGEPSGVWGKRNNRSNNQSSRNKTSGKQSGQRRNKSVERQSAQRESA